MFTFVITHALLALSLIAPAPDVRPDERPTLSSARFAAADSVRALTGQTFTFPRTVLAADYDSVSRTLFALLAPPEPEPIAETTITPPSSAGATLIAWDVERNQARWVQSTSRGALAIVGDRLLLSGSKNSEVLDPTSGVRIASLADLPWSLRSLDALITAEKDHVRRIDPHTGRMLWDFPISGSGRYPEVRELDGELYVIAHGLARLDPELGTGWHHEERLVRSQTLSRAIRGIFTLDPSSWGWEASQLYAPPLPVGDVVFFAADSEVISLNRVDGTPHWRWRANFDPRRELLERGMGIPQTLRRTPGYMRLGFRPGSLGVVATGWAMLNGAPALAERPAIAILDPRTGRRMAGRLLDSVTTVQNYFRGPQGHYLVTDGSRLRRLDDSLRTRADFRLASPAQIREIGGWHELIVSQTTSELLLLDPVTLATVWRHGLGGGVEAHARGTWFSGHLGLLEWSSRGDTPTPHWYPIPQHASVVRGAWVIVTAGSSVHVLRIPPAEASESLLDPR